MSNLSFSYSTLKNAKNIFKNGIWKASYKQYGTIVDFSMYLTFGHSTMTCTGNGSDIVGHFSIYKEFTI